MAAERCSCYPMMERGTWGGVHVQSTIKSGTWRTEEDFSLIIKQEYIRCQGYIHPFSLSRSQEETERATARNQQKQRTRRKSSRNAARQVFEKVSPVRFRLPWMSNRGKKGIQATKKGSTAIPQESWCGVDLSFCSCTSISSISRTATRFGFVYFFARVDAVCS